MELNDLIMDSIVYPSKNVKALAIYMLLSIIMGIVAVATGITNTSKMAGLDFVVALIGIIVLLALIFLVEGYVLDIVKFGIERRNDAPEIDFVRQVSNGVKVFIVSFAYIIIPTIVLVLSGNNIVGLIISLILFIVFGLFLSMAQCRLAQSEEIMDALNVKGVYDDIMAIGFTKVILTIIVVGLVTACVSALVSVIFGMLGNELLTAIVAAIVNVYLLFFSNRAVGLLYSDR